MSSSVVSAAELKLLNGDTPINERFRALFTLSNLAEEELIRQQQVDRLIAAEDDLADRARSCIEKILLDEDRVKTGALLRHEAAYTLGQMGDGRAVDTLIKTLENMGEDAMVRHEAAEALGALGPRNGGAKALAALEAHRNDPVREVSETCEIALDRFTWAKLPENENHGQALGGRAAASEAAGSAAYFSVDPAPAGAVYNSLSVEVLRTKLLNPKKSLFRRYQAMFALRNKGGDAAALALCDGFNDESALFRHEIAYVLGQLQAPVTQDALARVLRNKDENPMVRHEAAEALGAIAGQLGSQLLEEFKNDENRVVRESCEVGLDITEYVMSEDQFQPLDGSSAPSSKEVKIAIEKREA